MRMIAGAVLFGALAGVVFAQSTPPATAATGATVKFEIADIHASPPRRFPFFQGAFLQDGRYIARQATLADLVTTAYGLKDSGYVHGGPNWLEWDRWDVIGKVPPGTTDATAKQMLQSLLKDRFHLAVHSGSGDVPTYALTVEKDKPSPNLKPAGSSEESACAGVPRPPNTPPGTIVPALLHCHNMTMEKFAQVLPTFAGAYIQKPMEDRTGLKGAYDFDVQWTSRVDLARAGQDGISVFDALDRQLGLKLALGTAPGSVFVVDSVNETPTPNEPDLAKVMPPLPPPQFEVAVIRQSAPDEKQGGRIAGDEINVRALPLKFLIDFAWDLNPNEELVGAPKWLDSDKIDLEGKVASENLIEGAGKEQPPVAIDDLREMLKTLLIDRFEIKAHMEDRLEDAYTLVAANPKMANPKMTKADPTERTQCKEGPGPDGKDPRLAHPILNMLVTCHNVSTEQASKLFLTFAAWYLRYPVVDKTGLKGGWDFTLSWSSGNFMPGSGAPSAPAAEADGASDPNGALSFYDAVNKELGLKLVKEKRAEQVLVFDRIDEQPTPN